MSMLELSPRTRTFDPRGYQARAVQGAFSRFAAGAGTTALWVMATGTGKTVSAALAAAHYADTAGRPSLFVVDKRDLVRQTVKSFRAAGLKVAVEMAHYKTKAQGPAEVVVATRQTLAKRLGDFDPDAFGLVTFDEAHRCLSDEYQAIRGHFADAWLIGMTATPFRGDRRNLGSIWPQESVVINYSVADALTDPEGPFLVRPREEYVPCGVDLTSISTRGKKDYDPIELAEAIGPHVEALMRGAREKFGDRQTVVFMPDVMTAQAAANVLRFMGVHAKAVWGSANDREVVLEEYGRGDLQVVVNCDLLAYGWDDRPTSCVVIARPTKLKGRYMQYVGRGTRLADGKSDCLVLNFDWKTRGKHDLRTIVDLFDDRVQSKEQKSLAEDILQDGGADDALEALELAARKIVEREREAAALADEEKARKRREAEEKARPPEETFKVRVTGHKRAWQWVERDIVGVANAVGMTFDPRKDFDPRNPWAGGPIRPWQAAKLRAMKVTSVDGLTYAGANKMLKRLTRRAKAGLASPQLLQLLRAEGVHPQDALKMTARQATAYLASKGE